MPPKPLLHSTCVALALLFATCPILADEKKTSEDPLAKENLVAWCIVPFDASKRGPKARAEMLQRLGVNRCAYDWRDEHVATFEEEILEYKKHGIEYFAFWSQHEKAFALFEKHTLSPQIWTMLPQPNDDSQEAKVMSAAEAILPVLARAKKMGSKVGLYNHGGWGGEPENMVAVCEWLQTNKKIDNVGIVYNFHHGHEHIADFAKLFEKMQPHLLCLNLNGMNDGAQPKILPIGRGKHERDMIKSVLESGYKGPVGILDHRSELDAEESLKQNLDGLEALRKSLQNG